MSETQQTLFNRRVSSLWMAGAFILLAIVFVVNFPSSSPPILEPVPVKGTPKAPPRLSEQPRTPSRARFQSSTFQPPQSDFYRTIIDNNLFRPLGWTRPVSPPAYRLLGTMVPKDGKTPPQAIIQVSTAGNKTHIVSIDDTLDVNTKVVDIQPKQVVLNRAGQQTTLKLDTSPWISTSRGHFSH
ncbi:MAG: hypothetical protein OXL96_08500 [Candidatus Poribacteria bacterium]|nr:hypothetical protein [Candidatus Poribacteria bacterium]